MPPRDEELELLELEAAAREAESQTQLDRGFWDSLFNMQTGYENLTTMPGRALEGLVNLPGTVFTGAKNLIAGEEPLPKRVETAASGIGQAAIGLVPVPGAITGFNAAADFLSAPISREYMKSPGEYGQQLQQEIIDFGVPATATKASRFASRTAPRVAEEFAASAEGITGSPISQSGKVRFKPGTTTAQPGPSTPIMDSYRIVKEDGGLGGSGYDPRNIAKQAEYSPNARLIEIDNRINQLAMDVDGIIAQADINGAYLYYPDYKNAEAIIETPEFRASEDYAPARKWLDEEKARRDAQLSGKLSDMQLQKKAIYSDLGNKAYNQNPALADPHWKTDLKKAVASDLKEAIEFGADHLAENGLIDPSLAGQIRELNTKLGAYYDVRPAVQLRETSARGKPLARGKDLGHWGATKALSAGFGAAAIPGYIPGVSQVGDIGALNAGVIGREATLADMMNGKQLNAPLPVTPAEVLSRDWSYVKQNKAQLAALGNKVVQMGQQQMLPYSGDEQDFMRLPEQMQQSLHNQVVSIDPGSEAPPKGYWSATKQDGQWRLPPGPDRDMEMNDILKIKDAGVRAWKASRLQESGIFDVEEMPEQVSYITETVDPFERFNQLDFASESRDMPEFGPGPMTSDLSSMLDELHRAQRTHNEW